MVVVDYKWLLLPTDGAGVVLGLQHLQVPLGRETVRTTQSFSVYFREYPVHLEVQAAKIICTRPRAAFDPVRTHLDFLWQEQPRWQRS
jgi:hypothetical protein